MLGDTDKCSTCDCCCCYTQYTLSVDERQRLETRSASRLLKSLVYRAMSENDGSSVPICVCLTTQETSLHFGDVKVVIVTDESVSDQ